jgi:hypothetical protein
MAQALLILFLLHPDHAVGFNDNRENDESLSVALDYVLRGKSLSCHEFLRKSSSLVESFCQGKEWPAAKALMKKEGFSQLDSWRGGNGDHLEAHFLVRKNVHVAAREGAEDYLIILRVHFREKQKNDPGIVREAISALVLSFNQPYEKAIKLAKYPEGSVIKRILSAEEVKNEADKWPILKNVQISYGLIFNRWSELQPHGFNGIVEFAASPERDVGQKSISFSVASGLDPLQFWDGKKNLRGFKPEDKLYDLEFRGSAESWSGDQATVEANKTKYLKKK